MEVLAPRGIDAEESHTCEAMAATAEAAAAKQIATCLMEAEDRRREMEVRISGL